VRTSSSTAVLGPNEGMYADLGTLGARLMLGAAETGERFSLVEHPIVPRGLAAPLHMHANEDEYSFVLEGKVGFQLGDDVVYGEPGDLVFKPRGIPHAFWNAGDEAARVLEIISPGGFEAFFTEMAALMETGDFDAMGELFARYELDFDESSVEILAAKHGLVVDPTDVGLATEAR
jgi:quercetin dioxygenase-like cupin family protein